MDPAFAPLRNRDNERKSAVASSMGSHSRTTDVCVAFRQRSTGAEGEEDPYLSKMEDWRVSKPSCSARSEVVLRLTVMSTMEPDEMDEGRRMDGNSI